MYARNSSRIRLAVLFALCMWARPLAAATPEDAYAAAFQHYSQEHWAEAEAEFARFVQDHPSHEQAPAAAFLGAEAVMQQGRYDEARQRFFAFLEKYSDTRLVRPAIFRAGEAAYLSANHDEARRNLDWFRDDYPNDPLNAYTLTYLADIELTARKGKVAAGLYRQALKSFPEGALAPECRFGLGRALELLGQTEDATREYAALSAANGRLAQDAQVQLGIVYYNRHDFEQAEQAFTEAVRRFPDGARRTLALYWLGMAQISQQKWADAVKTLEQGAPGTRHPLAAATLFWAGEASRHLPDLEKADAYFTRVLADWPDSEWADDALLARLELVGEAHEHKRVDTLAQQFEANHAQSPLRLHARQVLGRSLLERAAYDRALEVLQPLVQMASAHVTSAPADTMSKSNDSARANWYYTALAYLGLQQSQEALEALTQIELADSEAEFTGKVRVAQGMALVGLGRYDEALVPLGEYLASHPHGPEAPSCRAELAIALTRRGRWEEGWKVYAELSPPDRARPRPLQAAAELAEAAYHAARYDTAESLFTALAQQRSSAASAAQGLSGLGWVAFQRQDLPLAAERFGRLLQQDPDGPLAAEAAMMQATCWDKLGRAEPALAAYLAVATRHEDSHYAAMAWFQAARLQEQAGQPEEALQSLHRVLERHPTFPHRDAALYQTATLLVKLDRAHEADDLFRQLSDDHRDSRYWAEATYRLAERSAAAEQYTRAAQLIEQILAAKGEPEVLGHAAYLKGQLAAHDGRWDEAILAFQRVVTLLTDPHWRAAAWLQEAKAHVAKHDPEAARRLLTLLLAEYPRSPFAQEARQYLERANVERPNSGKSEMATTSLDASE